LARTWRAIHDDARRLGKADGDEVVSHGQLLDEVVVGDEDEEADESPAAATSNGADASLSSSSGERDDPQVAGDGRAMHSPFPNCLHDVGTLSPSAPLSPLSLPSCSSSSFSNIVPSFVK
jgi:hypothetical protein